MQSSPPVQVTAIKQEDEPTINACYDKLDAAIKAYARTRPDDSTAQFLQDYFLGTHIGDEAEASPATIPGKARAIVRIEALGRGAIAYSGGRLDQALLDSEGIADTLGVIVASERQRRAQAETGRPESIRDIAQMVDDVGENAKRALHGMPRREMMSHFMKGVAVAAGFALSGKEEQGARSPREQFIAACKAAAERPGGENDEHYGELYDNLRSDPAAGAQNFARGVGAATALDHLLAEQNYATTFVETLAAAVRPRIDAVMDWNAGLPTAGFIDMAASRKPSFREGNR